MIVLDTNVMSELIAPQPSVIVKAWFISVSQDDLWTTAITKAELLYGLQIMPASRRRGDVARGIAGLFERFAGRILGFDERACEPYADIVSTRRRSGAPIQISDAQIAAIARAAGMAIATRNVADFADCGIDIINPWSAA